MFDWNTLDCFGEDDLLSRRDELETRIAELRCDYDALDNFEAFAPRYNELVEENEELVLKVNVLYRRIEEISPGIELDIEDRQEFYKHDDFIIENELNSLFSEVSEIESRMDEIESVEHPALESESSRLGDELDSITTEILELEDELKWVIFYLNEK